MSRIRLSKIAQPANPPASALEIYYDTSKGKLCAVDESGNVLVAGGFSAQDYRLITVTEILQGTTSYTPTSGARALFVECVGGGGQGGGATNAATNAAGGGGGGAGGYSCLFTTTIKTFTVAVGAGGSTGTGGQNGQAGGDTTFDSPSICTAKGGNGGTQQTVAAGPVIGGAGGAGGASASGVGDMKADGGPGGFGMMLAAAQAISGAGGNSFFGGGALPKVAQSAGGAAGNYGAGGSGGCILSGGASVAGGAGGNGLIRVWELG